jgi:hypothetical protein
VSPIDDSALSPLGFSDCDVSCTARPSEPLVRREFQTSILYARSFAFASQSRPSRKESFEVVCSANSWDLRPRCSTECHYSATCEGNAEGSIDLRVMTVGGAVDEQPGEPYWLLRGTLLQRRLWGGITVLLVGVI